MRTFLTVLSTNYKRTLPRMGSIIVITLVSLASMVLAVYMTNKQQAFANIAIVGQVDENKFHASEHMLHITFLETEPPMSDLYEQKYDAYITINESEEEIIHSLKSTDFKSTIMALLENPETQIPTIYAGRGTGENIIGFMMMFLLMISFGNLYAFADDKEQGQMKRVFGAPTSFGWYIGAHIIYSLSMFVPQFLLLMILKLLSINIGFSIITYFAMILLIGFLGSSFALFLNTVIQKPDNANMLGNAVTVLSSILAGTFYSFHKNNRILDGIIKVIPQKQVMNIASSIGNNQTLSVWAIIYVVVFSLIMFSASCIVLKAKYIKKS